MIIGLAGKMGSGKSTAVETLQFYLKDQVKLVKLAQPLYDIQEFAYRRIQQAYQRPSDFVKDRKLLQFLGGEWGRDSLDKNLWLNLWKYDAVALENRGFLVVCDDVRYDNEAEMIKDLGGIIIRIDAENTHTRINTANGIYNHQSEKGLPDHAVSYIIENNGTKSEYQDKLQVLFKQILQAIKPQK